MRTILRALLALVAIAVLVIAVFAANVALGMHAHARTDGTISGLALRAPVSVLRDGRGVPHVVAANEHDLFFAQGYAQASDRLFQMDLLRRYVEGNLAEVFGGAALGTDVASRAVPVRAIVDAQWQRMDERTRGVLEAYTDGVNAAMEREPLPVEFRILAYRPQRWAPRDSLSVAMALALDLIDDWNAIEPRNAAYRNGGRALEAAAFPLSDPCYDAPLLAGLQGMAPGRACSLPRRDVTLLRELGDPRPPIGSNEFAAGANRTSTGRALLANDPHLALHVPGWWHLIDLHAPGFHVAGAALPGMPCVVLGHNERLAWGLTDGTVASLSVFLPPAHLDPGGWHDESINVRFRRDAVVKRYYRTGRYFGVTTGSGAFVLVDWNAYRRPVSPAQAFFDLDRAQSAREAIALLAKFPGPTHNFALADTGGRAGYVLAGEIPSDPVWARWFHPARDLGTPYPPIPYARMPRVAPSRDAVVWTANNLMYAPGYPYRLSPQFASPYRAYRIAQLLRARKRYDVAYFARIQLDALSLPELELARDLAPALRSADPAAAAALERWNGEMTGDSSEATIAQTLRVTLTRQSKDHMMPLLEAVRRNPNLRVGALASPAPWSIAGAVPVLHSLSSLGIDFLNGTTLPGYGDAFTPHVQYAGYSQSFRAVWDVGNWDAGGITLPQGESGEPGSGHYTDQAAAWVSGKLWPLPFSDAAVGRTAVERETLTP